MISLTFLHAADLHLDSPFKGMEGNVPPLLQERMKESTFQAFRRIIDLAIEEQVDFVLLAGDIYDSEAQSLAAQLFVQKQLQRLHACGIQVYMSYGNHDHLGGKRALVAYPDNVHVFTEPEVEAKPFCRGEEVLAYIYGFSYPQRAVAADMTTQYQRKADAAFHIGMLHGAMEGETEHSAYAPFRLASLLEKEFHYWALGHIHKRRVLHEEPPVIYPGNIQGRHRKETGEKGCYLVRLQQGRTEYTFYPTADVIWEEAEISIEGMGTVDELLDACTSTMNQRRRQIEGVLLLLTFSGIGPMGDLLADERQREDLLASLLEAEDQGNFVYIAAIYNRTIPDVALEELERHPFLGGLLAETKQLSHVREASLPLWSSASARQMLEPFTEEEEAEILEEAGRLLLQLLAEGRESHED